MDRTILIVDDEPDFHELLSFILKIEGYEVVTAVDGLDAVRQAQRLQPDLILLDLMMPELDGISVCEILKRNAATAMIPVVMLTAWGTETAREVGLKAGACHYFTKPFSPRELTRKVNQILLGGPNASTTPTTA